MQHTQLLLEKVECLERLREGGREGGEEGGRGGREGGRGGREGGEGGREGGGIRESIVFYNLHSLILPFSLQQALEFCLPTCHRPACRHHAAICPSSPYKSAHHPTEG